LGILNCIGKHEDAQKNQLPKKYHATSYCPSAYHQTIQLTKTSKFPSCPKLKHTRASEEIH
jgi:hypothetical protein